MTEKTIKMVLDFRGRRNWKQFRNPKNLALSSFWRPQSFWISFNEAVLIWSAQVSAIKIAAELADVLNYCVLMADRCDLDLNKIVQKKV